MINYTGSIPKYFYEDAEYSVEELQEAADNNGVSLEEYIEKVKAKGLTIEEDKPGNELYTAESSVIAGEEQEDTESSLEDTSLVSPDPDPRRGRAQVRRDEQETLKAEIEANSLEQEPLSEEDQERIDELGGTGRGYSRALEIGLNRLYAGVAGVPESVYNFFSLLSNEPIAYLTGDDSWSVDADKFKESLGIENKLLEGFEEEAEKLQKDQQEYKELAHGGQSVSEAIGRGDYGDAFQLMGLGLTESAPTSIAMMVGGAYLGSAAKLAAISTPVFMEEARSELKEEDPSMSNAELTLKSFGIAGAETVFASISSKALTNVYKDIVKKEGAEAGGKVFKDGIVSMYSQAIKKYGIGATQVGEGLEEVATTMTQNAIKGAPILQGVNDSFLLGVGGGTIYGAPVTASNLTKSVKEKVSNSRVQNKLQQIDGASIETLFDQAMADPITAAQLGIVNIKGSENSVKKSLEKSVKDGNITPEQGAQSLAKFKQIQDLSTVTNKIDLTEDQTVEAINLITEKQGLEKQIEGVDPALAFPKKTQIEGINDRLRELSSKAEVEKSAKFAETEGEKIGLVTKTFETTEDIKAQIEKDNIKLSDNQKSYLEVVGGFVVSGNIYINKEAAAKTGQINIGAHELLHPIVNAHIGNVENQTKIVAEFKEVLDNDTAKKVDQELFKRGYRTKQEYNTEYLNVFSDLIKGGKIEYNKENETVFTKIGDILLPIFRALGFKKISFATGEDVYNFMREYTEGAKKGKLSKAIVKKVGDVGGAVGALQLSKQLTPEQDTSLGDNILEIKKLSEENAAIAKKFGKEPIKGPKQARLEQQVLVGIKSTVDRIVTNRTKALYDPIAADAKKNVSREEFQESMRADIETMALKEYNGKQELEKFLVNRGMLRANDLAKRLGIKSVEEGIDKDIETAKGIAVEETEAPTKVKGESVERGQATFDQLDLVDDALVDGVKEAIDKEIRLRTKKGKLSESITVKRGRKEALVPWAEEFINKQLFKKVMKRWGAIGESKGEIKIPGAYIDFLNDQKNFDIIMKALPIKTIKKSYSKLFSIEQIGRELTAEGNPIYKIAPIDKKTFLQYFLDGKKTTVLERQKQLAREIITPVVKESIADYATVDNLTDLEAIRTLAPEDAVDAVNDIIVSAQLNEIESQLDRYKNEDKSFDQIQFSKVGKVPSPFTKSETKLIYKHSKKVAKSSEHIASTEFANLPENVREFVKYIASSNTLRGKTYGGLIFEKLTTNDINAYAKQIGVDIKAVIEGEAGYDSTEPDIQIILKDKEGRSVTLLVEAKQSVAVRFGQVSIGFKDGKVFITKRGEKINPNSIPGGVGLLATIQEADAKLKQILSFLSKEEGKTFTKFPLGASISPDTNIELKKQDFYQEFNKLTQDTEQGLERVIKHYNSKGVYYMQIGKKGLYYLGKDIHDIGVPALNADFVVGVRLKDSTSSKTNRTTLSLISEPKIKNAGKLVKSNVDLNTLEGMKEFAKATEEITEIQTSIDLSKQFNDIIETKTGVKAAKTFSDARAQVMGAKKGKFKWLIPPGAEDFVGLMYSVIGKGKVGEQQKQWLKESLLDPYANGINNFERYQQRTANTLKELRKKIKRSPADLNKKGSSGFKNEDAIRVWLWNKTGAKVPGLNKQDAKEMMETIDNNSSLRTFAIQLLGSISTYPDPETNWLQGNVTSDIVNMVNTSSRAEFLTKWKENKDVIFSKDNLNKLEAEFGTNYREQLEDMLYRMEFGRSRPTGSNKYANRLLNWVNDSVATIMFFNTRSAILQQLSIINFLNFEENNPVAAMKAFGNQKQYWKDFSLLFNSDFLKQRRTGLKTDVNANIIIQATDGAQNKARAAYQAMVKIGFLPTTMSDSFAIATGGAAYYRNNLKKYVSQGMSEADAKKQAFLDFQEKAEETQQSSRPDRVSNQQASPLGRLILAFANTPMQMARLSKKAILDLVNGRGDTKANVAKLAYYAAVQNIIFATLQGGLMFMLFGEEEEGEKELKEKKEINRINSVADSILRGLGLTGAIVSTGKNIILEVIEQTKKDRPDYEKAAIKSISLSPPLNSKVRKALSAARAFTYKNTRSQMEGYSLDNPAYLAVSQIISAGANIPLDRLFKKLNNLRTMTQEETKTWQAIALALGYSEWDLGMMESQKKKLKKKKKKRGTTMVNRGGEFFVKEYK